MSEILIGYLENPNKVFYNTLDDVLVKRLENQGAKVIRMKLEEIRFKLDRNGDQKQDKIGLYIGDNQIKLDGFLNYGAMSQINYKAVIYINNSLHSMGVALLHEPEYEYLLNDKYLQGLNYTANGISTPSQGIGFSVESMKYTLDNNYNDEPCISKRLNDYGGDGINLHLNKDTALSHFAKVIWSHDFALVQKYIKDVQGKSVRVTCVNGKAKAVAEFNDKTGNFKSNNNYGFELFSLDSLMESPKLNEYIELGEKACKSITGGKTDLVIAGVDIVDSKENGLLVLETNLWPDVFDITESTKIDIFDLFIKAFYDKVVENKSQRNGL
jgi:ribosomal protein S6--L-glutamate ligase